MKFGIVKGRVVLSRSLPVLGDTRYLIVHPVTAENLAGNPSRGGGRELIVADRTLGPAEGALIGYVEGREGANPWHPARAPVDAFCSLIAESVSFHPQNKNPGKKGKP